MSWIIRSDYQNQRSYVAACEAAVQLLPEGEMRRAGAAYITVLSDLYGGYGDYNDPLELSVAIEEDAETDQEAREQFFLRPEWGGKLEEALRAVATGMDEAYSRFLDDLDLGMDDPALVNRSLERYIEAVVAANTTWLEAGQRLAPTELVPFLIAMAAAYDRHILEDFK